MDSGIFRIPLLRSVFRGMKAVPIAARSADPEVYERAFATVAAEFEAGHLVCIFPEGWLTRVHFRFLDYLGHAPPFTSVACFTAFATPVWRGSLRKKRPAFLIKLVHSLEVLRAATLDQYERRISRQPSLLCKLPGIVVLRAYLGRYFG